MLTIRSKSLISLVTAGITLATLAACGAGETTTGSAPPRRPEDAEDGKFSLASGTYIIDRMWDINDGCSREPARLQDSTNFTILNSGDGHVTIDRCEFNGKSTSGDILDNHGVLAVRHTNRSAGADAAARYDEECRMNITLTGNDEFEVEFSARESNRNEKMQEALNSYVASCTTSYKYTMIKR